MNPLALRRIGKTSFEVTQLGFGGATMGDGREVVPEAQAEATLEAALASGIRYFDTSPWYGNGKSEHRFGHVLRTKPRDSFVISTKVGRVHFRPQDPVGYRHPRWVGGLPFDLRFDYTRDGILKSYEMSLARLGINTVDALLIHDLDPRHQQSEEGVARGLEALDNGGGYRALAELKSRGEIKAIGAGVNHFGMIPRFVERFDIDFFLIAMPYTLLEQEALDGELQLCQSKGISVVIGAPFASGILARGAVPGALYRYAPAEPEVLAKAQRIEAACRRYDVPLAAAALQFPFGHPSVAAIIPGPITADEARQNVALMGTPIPGQLWEDLKREGLIRQDAPVPSTAS